MLQLPQSLDGLRVLVVDDEADAREFVTAVLKMHGIGVRTVASAAAALEELKQFRPDALLGDIRAIKFPPVSSSVILELSVDAPYAQIRITDTGIGIAADFLPHVFDRFRQAEGINSVKGWGLGMAIARHIVKLHNGTIHAESEGEARGATFIIKLPLPKTSCSSTQAMSSSKR